MRMSVNKACAACALSPGVRSSLVPKIWYFVVNAGCVCLLPFVNLFYRQLGFLPAQIGLLCALKPWVSSVTGAALMGLADAHKLHFAMLVSTYLVQFLGRSVIALATSFGIQLLLALVTEAAASPMGTVVDAAVSAAATDEGGYGRARLWASVGWGCTAPIAGIIAAHAGLKASFMCFSLTLAVGLLPTLLLPVQVLSYGGQATQAASKAAGAKASARQQPQKGSAAADGKKRERMDSDVVGREGSGHGMATLVAKAAAETQAAALGVPKLAHQWSIPAAGRQGSTGTEPLVINLTADGRAEAQLAGAVLRRRTTNGIEPLSVDCSHVSVLASVSPSASLALEHPAGADSVWGGIKHLLSDIHIVTFFFLAFLGGVGNGCIGYLFLFLDELGASGTLMGLCLSSNCAAEVPVFYFSGQIINWLGSVERAFNLAMAAYVLRLSCYVMLPLAPSPSFVLAAELLQGATFALAYSAGTVNVKRIAPPHLRSTTQSLFAGLYGGIGAGLGGLVGGLLYGRLGARAMFATAAASVLAGWLLANAVLSLSSKQHEGYEQVGSAWEDVEGEAAQPCGAEQAA